MTNVNINVWFFIKETNDEYEINSVGSVRNRKTKLVLKYQISSRGYEYVNAKRVRIYKHRFIAKYFIPNPENKPFVNHIDGNKRNNNISNLEWCTVAENNRHAFKLGLCKNNKGLKSQAAKSVINLKTYKITTLTDASKEAGISVTTLSMKLRGLIKNDTYYAYIHLLGVIPKVKSA